MSRRMLWIPVIMLIAALLACGTAATSPDDTAQPTTTSVADQAADVEEDAQPETEDVAPQPATTPEPQVENDTEQVCAFDAQLVEDVTIPHHTEMAPGQPYEKVWRILNSGCQLWTPDTQIVYNQGNLLTGPQAATLNTSVAPGETIDIALPFTAPQDPGSYEAYYLLQTAQGETFGLAYYTGIVVPEEVEPADPIDDLAPPEGAEGPTFDICSWGASIVENGGTVEVEPGQPFSMTFTVYNGGSCDWPSGTQLFTISGDPILSDGTYTFSEGQLAAAGESVTFTLNGTAPNQEGIYAAVVGFRTSPNGIVFGPNLGLTVEVTFPQLDFVAPGG